MTPKAEMIYEEFLDNREIYETMKNIVLRTLQDVFSENNMMVAGLEARVKDPKSLQGKLERKGDKYTSLKDITDLMGCRVITFYTHEVDRVASLLENRFIIDWDNSIDKRAQMESNQFGYLSLHYICQIPPSMYHDPQHPQINQFKFEIQMRTVLQHLWATADHDSGYKSSIEIPIQYRRRFSRLAGVMELADAEFASLLKDIDSYRARVQALVQEGNLSDLALDGDSFRSYLQAGLMDELNASIASIHGAEISPTDAMSYLPVLSQMGIRTLGQLEEIKKANGAAAVQLATGQLAGKDLNILASTIGLRCLCIVTVLKNGGGKDGLEQFFRTLSGEKNARLFAEKNYNDALRFGIVRGEA